MKQRLQPTTLAISLITGSVLLSPVGASATLVTGWGAETGFANGTVTEGSPGSFTTSPTGNLGARSSLQNPFDLSVVGESVVLTGSVTLSAGTFGNQQLRFGLFNNNGNNPGTLSAGAWGGGAVASGWLGYIVEVGNANGSGTTALDGRNGTGANAWLSTTAAAYGVNTTQTDTGSYTTAPGTFSFDFTLTRLSATSVGIGYSFLETDGVGNFSAIGNFTDTGGLSSGISSINQVGFYTPGAALASSFSNVDIEAVPEPSTLALGGMGMLGLVAAWRRKK
jgi:hypothetical protein